jgi:hypothetical protein
VAVIGFAAFSPSGDTSSSTDQAAGIPAAELDTQVSARVASAILALRVTDTTPKVNAFVSSTAQELETTTTLEEATTTSDAPGATSSSSSSSTTKATTTTTKPRDTTPPALKITSPSEGATVSDRIVTFSGTAEVGAKVYSGPYDAKVKDNGEWSIKLVVATKGESTARITAEDAAGNTTVKSLTVTYKAPAAPPPPSPTTTQGSTPTTTAAPASWSPLWPADAGGIRNVEYWRPLVAKYWPDNLVNCALNLIHRESKGDPRAYNSGSKAEGLFQHLSKYWKSRAAAAGFRDSNGLYATPYNGEANIAAAWHIAKHASPWYKPWTVNPTDGPLECTP